MFYDVMIDLLLIFSFKKRYHYNVLLTKKEIMKKNVFICTKSAIRKRDLKSVG